MASADTVVRIKSLQSGVSAWLSACSERVNLIDGYLNRIVKQDYINTQAQRFENENVGDDFDGGKWANVDSAYSQYKRKKYLSYPGGGEKINIRTSNLLQSLMLSGTYYPGPEPKKIRPGKGGELSEGEAAAGFIAKVDAGSLHIYTLVPYADSVDEKRTFTQWSQHFWDRTNLGIMNYLAGKD